MTTSTVSGRSVPSDSPPEWWIFHGTGLPRPHLDLIERLSTVPAWRTYGGWPLMPDPPEEDGGHRLLGGVPDRADDIFPMEPARVELLDKVNAALHLRRPLLVSGPPGVGKSTLAYQIARELGLGRLLKWSVNSTSTVRSGLYEYDPVSQIHDLNLENTWRRTQGSRSPEDARTGGLRDSARGIGRYLALGPLGTAFLPYALPRVLLVDDFDLGDFDLSGDLLDLFESGEYVIPELERLSHLMGDEPIHVGTDDPDRLAPIVRGKVVCSAFPVVIITCNTEREFPAAFLRRCIPVKVGMPSERELMRVVAQHFRGSPPETAPQLVREFLQRGAEGGLSVDQLLNAVQLVATASPGAETLGADQLNHLAGVLWHHLTEPAG